MPRHDSGKPAGAGLLFQAGGYRPGRSDESRAGRPRVLACFDPQRPNLNVYVAAATHVHGSLCLVVCSVHFFVSWSFQMSSIQERIAAITDSTTELVAQLYELNELQERVSKAELARRSLRLGTRKQLTPPPNGFENSRSVSPT
jgi:hypothetical protein